MCVVELIKDPTVLLSIEHALAGELRLWEPPHPRPGGGRRRRRGRRGSRGLTVVVDSSNGNSSSDRHFLVVFGFPLRDWHPVYESRVVEARFLPSGKIPPLGRNTDAVWGRK